MTEVNQETQEEQIVAGESCTATYPEVQADVEPYYPLIRAWAEDRNLIQGATPQAQFVKLIEENGEFIDGIDTNDIDEIKDGLGDSIVVMTILAAQLGTSIEECVRHTLAGEGNTIALTQYGAEHIVNTILRGHSRAVGRLATGIAKKNTPMVKDGIGAAVVLINTLCQAFGTTLPEAVGLSYDVIKDRKGKMIDGVFVKEADFHIYGITE